jgi:hypothetical protein
VVVGVEGCGEKREAPVVDYPTVVNVFFAVKLSCCLALILLEGVVYLNKQDVRCVKNVRVEARWWL